LQESGAGELSDGVRGVALRPVRIDVEIAHELRRDVLHGAPAVAVRPHERRRGVELVDAPEASIEHDGLPVHDADVDVGPSQWVKMGHGVARVYPRRFGRVNPVSCSRPVPNLIDVLKAAGGADDGHHALQDLDERRVRWAVATGLGPLLRAVTPEGSRLTRSPAWPLVLGADLAARLEAADRLEAVVEILDAAPGRLPPPVLLKGISLCAQEYPQPHLRPMRDVDLLVDQGTVPEVESILAGLGYERRGAAEAYRAHHHGAPFVHPRSQVWVEVHHRLFPSRSALGADSVFGEEAVRSQQCDSTLRGRAVRRLTPEMQVVYLCAHWASSAKLLRGPGGLLPLLDLMYLIRAHDVRWPVVLAWLDGSAAAPGVYALAAYAARAGLVAMPADVLDGLRRRQRAFNPVTRALAFALIDAFMVEGRRLPRGARTAVAALWKALFRGGSPPANLAH
jgi:hypothetical protein